MNLATPFPLAVGGGDGVATPSVGEPNFGTGIVRRSIATQQQQKQARKNRESTEPRKDPRSGTARLGIVLGASGIKSRREHLRGG